MKSRRYGVEHLFSLARSNALAQRSLWPFSQRAGRLWVIFPFRPPSRHSMHSMRRRRNSCSHSVRGERKIERFFEPERPTMVIYATERNHDVSLPQWTAIRFPPSFSRFLLPDWDRQLNFRFFISKFSSTWRLFIYLFVSFCPVFAYFILLLW